jgi:hypothetical protein
MTERARHWFSTTSSRVSFSAETTATVFNPSARAKPMMPFVSHCVRIMIAFPPSSSWHRSLTTTYAPAFPTTNDRFSWND